MNKRAYAIVVAGFLTVSINYSVRYAYGLLLPEMLPNLGISMTEAGVIFAAHYAMYTIFTPISGAFADRFNNRILLTLCTTLLAVGALLMGVAASVTAASFYFALAGIGAAACWVPVVALVQRWVPEGRKGTALSIVTMGVGIGVTAWGIVLPSIVSAWNWSAGWFGLGIFGLIVAVLNLLLVRNPPATIRDATGPHRQVKPDLKTYAGLIRNRVFWIIGMAYIFVGISEAVPFTFISIYTRDELGFSYHTAARLISTITACGLVSQLVLGTLSDIVGRVRIMILCGILLGVGCLLIGYVKSPAWMYATVALYGLGFGAVWPMYGAVSSDFFPKSLTGGVVGLWTLFLGLGSICAPIVSGWIVDTTGRFEGVFVLGGLGGLLSAVIILPLLRVPVHPAKTAE